MRLHVLKLEGVSREHASIQVAQHLIFTFFLFDLAHDSCCEVDYIAKDREFFPGA